MMVFVDSYNTIDVVFAEYLRNKKFRINDNYAASSAHISLRTAGHMKILLAAVNGDIDISNLPGTEHNLIAHIMIAMRPDRKVIMKNFLNLPSIKYTAARVLGLWAARYATEFQLINLQVGYNYSADECKNTRLRATATHTNTSKCNYNEVEIILELLSSNANINAIAMQLYLLKMAKYYHKGISFDIVANHTHPIMIFKSKDTTADLVDDDPEVENTGDFDDESSNIYNYITAPKMSPTLFMESDDKRGVKRAASNIHEHEYDEETLEFIENVFNEDVFSDDVFTENASTENISISDKKSSSEAAQTQHENHHNDDLDDEQLVTMVALNNAIRNDTMLDGIYTTSA